MLFLCLSAYLAEMSPGVEGPRRYFGVYQEYSGYCFESLVLNLEG